MWLRRRDRLPEAVTGWRLWGVEDVDGDTRLVSLTRSTVWEPLRATASWCLRPTHLRPARRCRCGVYALASAEELALLGPIAGGAIGQVSLWGKVIEHERGLRAEFAYPSRVRLVCMECAAGGRAVAPVIVERGFHRTGIRLAPRCAEHATPGARDVRAPAEVERALLDAYAVDLLPVESASRFTAGAPAVVAAEHLRQRARRRLTATLAALAAVMLVGGGLGFALSRTDPVPAPRAAISHPSPAPGSLGVPEPSDGAPLGAFPPVRVLLQTPGQLDRPRCARVVADRIREVSCVDPGMNAWVRWAVPPGEPCPGATVEITREGDLRLCWRLFRHAMAG